MTHTLEYVQSIFTEKQSLYRAELQDEIKKMISRLQRELEYLQTNNTCLPFPDGPIGSMAGSIDRLRGELSAFNLINYNLNALASALAPAPTPPAETVANPPHCQRCGNYKPTSHDGDLYLCDICGDRYEYKLYLVPIPPPLTTSTIPQPEPTPNDTAKAARLTKAQRKILENLANGVIISKYWMNGTFKYPDGASVSTVVVNYLTTAYSDHHFAEYIRKDNKDYLVITDAGRAALGIGTGA
jgi:hypothetical protein